MEIRAQFWMKRIAFITNSTSNIDLMISSFKIKVENFSAVVIIHKLINFLYSNARAQKKNPK